MAYWGPSVLVDLRPPLNGHRGIFLPGGPFPAHVTRQDVPIGSLVLVFLQAMDNGSTVGFPAWIRVEILMQRDHAIKVFGREMVSDIFGDYDALYFGKMNVTITRARDVIYSSQDPIGFRMHHVASIWNDEGPIEAGCCPTVPL